MLYNIIIVLYSFKLLIITIIVQLSLGITEK